MPNANFAILGVEHIGLAPKDAGVLREFLEIVLGLPFTGEEVVASQNTKTSFFSTGSQDARLEILESAPEGQGPIASFLQKKGGGIHHIALRVRGIEAALMFLQKKGVALIDTTPRPGAHGSRIAFIHPRSTGGILFELVER